VSDFGRVFLMLKYSDTNECYNEHICYNERGEILSAGVARAFT